MLYYIIYTERRTYIGRWRRLTTTTSAHLLTTSFASRRRFCCSSRASFTAAARPTTARGPALPTSESRLSRRRRRRYRQPAASGSRRRMNSVHSRTNAAYFRSPADRRHKCFTPSSKTFPATGIYVSCTAGFSSVKCADCLR